MGKNLMELSFCSVFLAGIFLSSFPAYSQNYSNTGKSASNSQQSSSYEEKKRSSSGYSQSGENYQKSSGSNPHRSEHENKATTKWQPITYLDERDDDIHSRANRMGDWDYRQNWRYDRKDFFQGDSQGEALYEHPPHRIPGVGMDRDNDNDLLYGDDEERYGNYEEQYSSPSYQNWSDDDYSSRRGYNTSRRSFDQNDQSSNRRSFQDRSGGNYLRRL